MRGKREESRNTRESGKANQADWAFFHSTKASMVEGPVRRGYPVRPSQQQTRVAHSQASSSLQPVKSGSTDWQNSSNWVQTSTETALKSNPCN